MVRGRRCSSLGLLPAVARAEWLQTGASIADRSGTGYVGLLNVDVKNMAVNDSTAVTEVWLSDDGEQWSVAPYTGEPQPWVLAGESGAKTVFVRFAGADGSLSPVVSTGIRVDTEPPRTQALLDVVGSSGGPHEVRVPRYRQRVAHSDRGARRAVPRPKWSAWCRSAR